MKFYAYFLPQFYPTPENDKYWGKGFTEWVNVKAAKPFFKGHKQPIVPTRFGYYNLTDANILEEICDYSQSMGIDGFCYWHYWFDNGFKTLEKVPEMHLSNKSIKQKFFFSWANHDWSKSWIGQDNTIIFKQKYSNESALEHFNYLKKFITDSRYVRIDNKPVLQVYRPETDGCFEYIKTLEKEAKKEFGHGFYWLFPERQDVDQVSELSFSKVGLPPANTKVTKFMILRTLQQKGIIKTCVKFSVELYLKALRKNIRKYNTTENSYLPCILSGWDNTPRYGSKGYLFDADIPIFIEEQFKVIENEIGKENLDIVFIKAWNEWAEGNILEPYSYDGVEMKPAEVIKKIKNKYS
ncbi:MAG: glycoside hydrolase family 99-like domain-containing protein [Salinivirgaceae bacterium]|jgi:hypothetical protein|nr:glycoside hydrolase family 99-like domain-containing protein [Salinivirgaceae bacterium]